MPRKESGVVAGSLEGGRRASVGEPGARGERGRLSSWRRWVAVLPVLLGRTLEVVAERLCFGTTGA